jgi:hypothetical protein
MARAVGRGYLPADAENSAGNLESVTFKLTQLRLKSFAFRLRLALSINVSSTIS